MKQILVKFILKSGVTFGVMMTNESARRLIESWGNGQLHGILQGTGGPYNYYAIDIKEVAVIDTADPDSQPSKVQGSLPWYSGGN